MALLSGLIITQMYSAASERGCERMRITCSFAENRYRAIRGELKFVHRIFASIFFTYLLHRLRYLFLCSIAFKRCRLSEQCRCREQSHHFLGSVSAEIILCPASFIIVSDVMLTFSKERRHFAHLLRFPWYKHARKCTMRTSRDCEWISLKKLRKSDVAVYSRGKLYSNVIRICSFDTGWSKSDVIAVIACDSITSKF